MGCNHDSLVVENWVIKKLSNRCYVTRKQDNFKCRITTIYGPTYDVKKDEFLLELHEPFSSWDGPCIIGGTLTW